MSSDHKVRSVLPVPQVRRAQLARLVRRDRLVPPEQLVLRDLRAPRVCPDQEELLPVLNTSALGDKI
jgi:hypothetical protein